MPNNATGFSADTLPKYFLYNASHRRDLPSIREKYLGIWQTWTWGEVYKEVEAYAIGLKKLGLAKGDKVAIIGGNRPRLYWSQLAAQTLGAIPVPVYADAVAEEMSFVLEHAEVRFAACEDQEQVDKVLSIAERLTHLEKVIYDDPRGLDKYEEKQLVAYDAVKQAGLDEIASNSEAVNQWIAGIEAGKGEDLSVMLYTSGTTGQPKGVMLNYNNMVYACVTGNAFDNVDENFSVISYLPMAWVGDHVISYGQSIVAGFCVACPESADTVTVDRLEIAPKYFFAPPRVFEGMLTGINVRMQDAGWMQRKLYHYFMAVAERVGEPILNGQSVGLWDRFLYALGSFCIYGPLKNQMGLSKVKVAYTAGEAIGPEIFKFFRSLGINLKQLYGQTEASVYVTIQPDGEIFADTVGKPAEGSEVKIKDDGEVIFKSPGVFVGYFKNDEATKETKTEDGWVKTGDAGFFDERGHLKIIVRAKDVGKLKNGALFAPKYIENKLKFYPDIREAVAFGDGRDTVTAFINIDLASVGNWAERNNVVYSSYQELAGNPQVYEIIRQHVDKVNQSLASEPMMADSQIKRFLVLHKELDADDGELTRTQKVRRRFIAERYAPLIEALYDGSDKKEITTEVTFEDGRQGSISAEVAIVDMDIYPSVKEAAE